MAGARSLVEASAEEARFSGLRRASTEPDAKYGLSAPILSGLAGCSMVEKPG